MSPHQKLVFMAGIGIDSNHVSDDSYPGNLCRLQSSLANLAKKDKDSLSPYLP